MNKLEIVIWDVQHGSAAFVRTPTGKTLAIDLGVGSYKNPSDTTFSPLLHMYHQWNFRSLDALIITHPHRDHLDDIDNLQYVPPKLILAPSIDRSLIISGNKSSDRGIIDQYFSWRDRYTGPVSTDENMNNPTTWGCSIQWFTPSASGPNLNNYSLVTVIGYAGSTIVIPGDNEDSSWRALLEQPAFVAAIKTTNVFVASHHGRESGYYPDLFRHFTPSLAIISDTNNIPTTASDKYTYQAEGWNVFNRETNTYEQRKTLTTRCDDSIHIQCWTGPLGQNPEPVNQMEVTIN